MIFVAEELAGRFGQPLWRFCNSGTEATMDAVHLMRAVTGRDLILKVEGCYHGHHDSVQVSVTPDAGDVGTASRPTNVPASAGVPEAIMALTIIVPFNDLDAVARAFDEHPGEIAGMIIEPIMMNAGIILPATGYLQGLKDLLHQHDVLLTFDEVKTGLTAGYGGATALTGVTPDITCLAKAIGGGIASAAVGGSAEVMEHVANGDYDMVGTFNGNPLGDGGDAGHADRGRHPRGLRTHRRAGVRDQHRARPLIATRDLPAHVVSVGAKGCVTFSRDEVRNYRDFLEVDDRYNHAHWLFQHNGGVFLPPWGKTEQWLISVQHDEQDVGRLVGNFERFAAAVGG